MADCPGVLHLAAMADGALARVRTPAGRLTSAQARAVASAAARLGSGVVDLTNRANLQIRGLAPDAGAALAEELAAAGLTVDGPADRRRNIVVDPYSGFDPTEAQDLRPLAAALGEALTGAPWIGSLSPKFSFSLDGGGQSGIAGVASDVTVLARGRELHVAIAGAAVAATYGDVVGILVGLARSAARQGVDARAGDLDPAKAFCPDLRRISATGRRALQARFGPVATNDQDKVALTIPAPVGRLSPDMLHWLTDIADENGQGALVLAPWSAVVVLGVPVARAAELLCESERRGFASVAVVERLRVIACAGAPACERAREPAKALGAELLALATADPARLPSGQTTVHLSACGKGCAGSAPADLLLLGSSDRSGWSLHAGGAPRAPKPAFATLDRATPEDILARLSTPLR